MSKKKKKLKSNLKKSRNQNRNQNQNQNQNQNRNQNPSLSSEEQAKVMLGRLSKLRRKWANRLKDPVMGRLPSVSPVVKSLLELDEESLRG
jgi:hypothetical protein